MRFAYCALPASHQFACSPTAFTNPAFTPISRLNCSPNACAEIGVADPPMLLRRSRTPGVSSALTISPLSRSTSARGVADRGEGADPELVVGIGEAELGGGGNVRQRGRRRRHVEIEPSRHHLVQHLVRAAEGHVES